MCNLWNICIFIGLVNYKLYNYTYFTISGVIIQEIVTFYFNLFNLYMLISFP